MKILFVIYDEDASVGTFPHGIAYLIPYLEKDGHEIQIYSQDIYKYTENHLTNYLDNNKFDVVAVGVIAGYYQFAKLLKISKAILASKNKVIYVLGGHGPSPDPKYFIEQTNAVFVICGEGYITHYASKSLTAFIDGFYNNYCEVM